MIANYGLRAAGAFCLMLALALLIGCIWDEVMPGRRGKAAPKPGPGPAMGAGSVQGPTSQSEPLPTPEQIDQAAGWLGAWLGGLGIPIAGAAGALWARSKPIKRITELIDSIQDARRELDEPARKKLDQNLADKQSDGLQACVRRVKSKAHIRAVTK